MKTVVGWSVFVGVLWFAGYFALQMAAIYLPDQRHELSGIATHILVIGQGLGKFITPILQLALVLVILASASKFLGINFSGQNISLYIRDALSTSNVQAFIAVLIVGSLCLAAIANIGQIGVLKDLALVVVGFYFGSRRRPGDPNEIEVVSKPAGPAPRLDSGPARGVDEGRGESAEELREAGMRAYEETLGEKPPAVT